MSKDTKLLRGQARQVLKEILPDLLKNELIESIRVQLHGENVAKLRAIQAEVQTVLERIDQRSKDINAYLVRATTTGNQDKESLSISTPEFKTNE